MQNKRRITFICSRGITKFSGYYFRVKKEIDILKYKNNNDLKLICLASKKKYNNQSLKRIKEEIIDNAIFIQPTNILRIICHLNKTDIIHAENPSSFFFSWFASKFIRKKQKIIFDYHGASSEEYKILGGNIFGYYLIKFWEYLSIKKSDAIILVSESHRKHIIKKYNIKYKKIFIVRNFIEDKYYNNYNIDKNTLRKKLCLPINKTIIIYSGNFQIWQEPEILKNIALELNKYIDQYIFLILSKDPKAKELANERSVILKTVDRNEVFLYLRASDVGILIRKQNIINQFSDPTKLAEYLSCGLNIFSSGIGDLKNIVAEYPEIGYYFEGELYPSEELIYHLKNYLTKIKKLKVNKKSLNIFSLKYNKYIAKKQLDKCYAYVS